MRLSGTKTGSANQYNGLGDQLYDLGGARPTLDLNFASNGSLVDSVTGKTLVTHTRASSATYVDGDGIIQTAGTNVPRFDHDPATGESLGLLVEESRTNLITNSDLLSDFQQNTAGSFTTVTETAPDNGTQVSKIIADQTLLTCRIRLPASSANSITVSAFVKKDTHRYIQIGFGGVGNHFCGTFDIEPGVTNRLISQSGTGTYTNIDAGYQDYANGWIRVWAAGTTTGTDGFGIGIVENSTKTNFGNSNVFDGTESIYVWGAQWEDNNTFPTSYIPTSGSTVTRAADVTSIEGNDFGTFNLLQYSEEFDFGWNPINSPAITPNAALAPNGTITADRLQCSGNVGVQQVLTVELTPYTYSLHVKQAGLDSEAKIRLSVGPFYFSFDLTTGTFFDVDASFGTPVAEPQGNGWWRIIGTRTATSTSQAIRIYAVGGGNTDVYIWGAQLEESSTVTPYVKSDVTFTSRASTATYYDYNGIIQTAAVNEARNVAFLPDGSGNFVSAGELLLEEARTNLIPNSESFTGFTVQQFTQTTASNIVAPDGTTGNVQLFTEDATNSVKRLFASIGTGSIPVSHSIFVKPATSSRLICFSSDDSSGTRQLVYFNLETGEITGTNSYTFENTFIHTLPNGWYRIGATITDDGVGNALHIWGTALDTSGGGNPAYQGDGVSGVYFWGAQMEFVTVYSVGGPYHTSYIPTSGSSATRAADVSSSSSNTFGNSFYNQTEGSVFANCNVLGDDGTNQFIYSISDGVLGDEIRLFKTSGNDAISSALEDSVGGITSNIFGNTNTLFGTPFKTVHAFAANYAVRAINGINSSVDNTVTVPVVNQVEIGARMNGTFDANIHLSRLTYWPTRLSNDTLQTITV